MFMRAVLFGLIGFWVCLAWSQSGGGFKPQVVKPEAVKPEAGLAQPANAGEGVDMASGGSPSPQIQDLLNRFGGDAGGEYFDGPTGVGGEYFGPGKMEACNQVPGSTAKALSEAKTFRSACPAAQRGDGQRIAINDYSQKPAYMYIFDLSGKCLGKTMVAFGNGAGGAQVACSDGGSHLTPPGFHLTALHDGGKYNRNNSLGMVGLQGQNSSGRAILIHPVRAPGTSSTWGCAGVGYEAFPAVKSSLGLGALVYNYFQPAQMAANCRNRSGSSPNSPRCQMDPSSKPVPNEATGQGTPAVAWRIAVMSEAHATQFPERLKIKKGTEITILRHLAKSDTYEIVMTREEAQGPNVATPEALKRALEVEGSLKDFKRRIQRDTGAVYVLKKDLPLLWEEEIFKRQKANKSK